MSVTSTQYIIGYECSADEEGWITVLGGPPGVEVTEHPEVCPEVWNTSPVDGDWAMAAVRAMSLG